MTNGFSVARARTLRANELIWTKYEMVCCAECAKKWSTATPGRGRILAINPYPAGAAVQGSVAIPRASSPIVISGLSFVNTDRTSLDVSAVQFLYRRLRSFIGSHLNETKPSRAISRSIDYYLGAVDFTCF